MPNLRCLVGNLLSCCLVHGCLPFNMSVSWLFGCLTNFLLSPSFQPTAPKKIYDVLLVDLFPFFSSCPFPFLPLFHSRFTFSFSPNFRVLSISGQCQSILPFLPFNFISTYRLTFAPSIPPPPSFYSLQQVPSLPILSPFPTTLLLLHPFVSSPPLLFSRSSFPYNWPLQQFLSSIFRRSIYPWPLFFLPCPFLSSSYQQQVHKMNE